MDMPTFMAKLKRFLAVSGLILWAVLSVVGLGFMGFQGWQINDLKTKVTDLEAKVLAQPAGPASPDATGVGVAGVPLGATTAGISGFSDIADCTSSKYINDLVAIGFFNDMGLGDKFYPYNGITRGEFAYWMFKARNLIRTADPEKQIRMANPNSQPYFRDVASTHPYYKYIQSLAENGFSVGYGDGTFQPDKVLTREEMIGMKYAVDEKSLPPRDPKDRNSHYTDSMQIDRRFVEYVDRDEYQTYCAGHFARVYGKTNMFKPKQPVLRHEAATAVWKSGCKEAV